MLPVQVLARLHNPRPVIPLRKRAKMQANIQGAAAVEEDAQRIQPEHTGTEKITVTATYAFYINIQTCKIYTW